jgi:hypothetical protein
VPPFLLGRTASIEVWYDREVRAASLVKEESEEAMKTACNEINMLTTTSVAPTDYSCITRVLVCRALVLRVLPAFSTSTTQNLES